MLLAGAEQLRERSKQTLDANSGNFDELTGEKILARFRAQRNRQNNHGYNEGGVAGKSETYGVSFGRRNWIVQMLAVAPLTCCAAAASDKRAALVGASRH
jgi:hypothetical protein